MAEPSSDSTPDGPLASVAEAADRQFCQLYKRQPHWIVAAPGRVNLIGEHTDYNGGYVLPMAIERYTVMAAAPADPAAARGAIRVASAFAGETVAADSDASKDEDLPQWARYVLGVVRLCERAERSTPGFDAWVESTVPVGAGLSSSAALEVATATLVEAITGQPFDLPEKARLCQRAEHEYAGVPCGIMDQFASVAARQDHAILLDCRSMKADWVSLSDPDIAVLVANTGVSRALGGGPYAERRRQCEAACQTLGVSCLRDADLAMLDSKIEQLDRVVARRARHVITEIERTCATAASIRAADWQTVGRLMVESHQSLRDDYEVSCEDLDVMVDLAAEIGETGGVFGSRMTGAGFGGCTVSLVRRDRAEHVAAMLSERFAQKTTITPMVFSTRAAGGARVIKPRAS